MRINLLGGPGSGKSTTSADLFARLKRDNISVEQVCEFVKSYAVQKRKINEFDQVYLFGKQMQYEYRWLSNGIKNIVTDSPTDLSIIYSRLYNPTLGIDSGLESINDAYNSKFPALNIFLNRGDKKFDAIGRYQTHEQAKEIDNIIYNYLANKYAANFYIFDYVDIEGIYEFVIKNVDK